MKKWIVLFLILFSTSVFADTKPSRKPFTVNGATGGTITGDVGVNGSLTVTDDTTTNTTLKNAAGNLTAIFNADTTDAQGGALTLRKDVEVNSQGETSILRLGGANSPLNYFHVETASVGSTLVLDSMRGSMPSTINDSVAGDYAAIFQGKVLLNEGSCGGGSDCTITEVEAGLLEEVASIRMALTSITDSSPNQKANGEIVMSVADGSADFTPSAGDPVKTIDAVKVNSSLQLHNFSDKSQYEQLSQAFVLQGEAMEIDLALAWIPDANGGYTMTTASDYSKQAGETVTVTALTGDLAVQGSTFMLSGDGNDYITVTDSANLEPAKNDFVFAFWLKTPASVTGSDVIFMKGDNSATAAYSAYMDSALKLVITLVDNNGGGLTVLTSPGGFPASSLNHIVISVSGADGSGCAGQYDNTEVIVYINGIAVLMGDTATAADCADGILSSAENLAILAENDGDNGLISELGQLDFSNSKLWTQAQGWEHFMKTRGYYGQ